MDNNVVIIEDMDKVYDFSSAKRGSVKSFLQKKISSDEFEWEKKEIALGPVIKYSEEEALHHNCLIIARQEVFGNSYEYITVVNRPYPRLFCQCCKVPN